MTRAGGTGGRRWEHRLLAVLAYPANLAFAGLAATLLAVGVVTALPAAVAAARAMDRWLAGEDDAVFTGVFREFAATWRRTLPLGVGAALVGVVLAVNVLFLQGRLVAGDTGLAPALLAASVPVAATLALFCLALPVAAAAERDGTAREWLVHAGTLVVRRPLPALVLLVLAAALALTFVLLPTLAPFFGLSAPVYLALVTFGRGRPPTGGRQADG